MMSDTQTQLDQDLAEATDVQSAADNGVPTVIPAAAVEPTTELPESSTIDSIDGAETAEEAEAATAEQAVEPTAEVEGQAVEQNGAAVEESSDGSSSTEVEA